MKSLKMNDYFFLGFLLLISFYFMILLKPFVIDIFLAAVLYIIFRKLFAYTLKKTRSRKKSSAITVFFVVLIVAIPMTFIVMMVSFEAAENYNYLKTQLPVIQDSLTKESLKELAHKLPVIGNNIADEIEGLDIEKLKETGSQVLMSVGTYTFKLVQAAFFNITSFIMHLFFTTFILFYLFLDGNGMITRIRAVLPFDVEDEKKAANELIKITDTIIIYTFLIGVLEGTYGGALFAILGISSPFFWGVLMVVLSMIPIVGANTIMVPAALILLFSGSYARAVILLIVGTGVILVNQNIIKPKIAGDRSGLHPVLMLVSTIGGIAWFGMSGFLAGPLIAALTIVGWDLFASKFKVVKPVKDE